MNYEVTRKTIPCAFYLSLERSQDECRWCARRWHIKEQYGSRTLCGHWCMPEQDWTEYGDMDYEDVPAIDRCYVCYQAVDRHS